MLARSTRPRGRVDEGPGHVRCGQPVLRIPQRHALSMGIRIAINDDAAGAVADDYACFDDNGSKWLIAACDCLVLHPGSLRDEELFKLGERKSLRAKVQYARNPASNECDELAPPHMLPQVRGSHPTTPLKKAA